MSNPTPPKVTLKLIAPIETLPPAQAIKAMQAAAQGNNAQHKDKGTK